jgi:hypothetical protein
MKPSRRRSAVHGSSTGRTIHDLDILLEDPTTFDELCTLIRDAILFTARRDILRDAGMHEEPESLFIRERALMKRARETKRVSTERGNKHERMAC